MSAKIKTTGQMREFLAKIMSDVQTGEIDLDKASKITKLAGQVNESFYAEIKVAKVRTEAGEQMTPLGDMPINKSET